MQKLMTIPEVAEYFKVSARSVNQWIKNGEMKSAKIKNRRLIAESEVIRFFIKRGGSISIIGNNGKLIPIQANDIDWITEELRQGIQDQKK